EDTDHRPHAVVVRLETHPGGPGEMQDRQIRGAVEHLEACVLGRTQRTQDAPWIRDGLGNESTVRSASAVATAARQPWMHRAPLNMRFPAHLDASPGQSAQGAKLRSGASGAAPWHARPPWAMRDVVDIDRVMQRLNPVVAWLLRSPLHPLLDWGLMLVTVTGRRSGRVYTIPVGYQRDGDGLVVLVSKPSRKQWWRNYRDRRPIGVVLQGRAAQ